MGKINLVSSKHRKLKKFIRKVLNCACPDEVFEHIEFERKYSINQDFPSITRINIGHRLLVYIYLVENLDNLNLYIKKLINFGNEEKRKQNFNRLRIVLVSNNIRETEYSINSSNKEYINNVNTQNIHLHILHKDTKGKI